MKLFGMRKRLRLLERRMAEFAGTECVVSVGEAELHRISLEDLRVAAKFGEFEMTPQGSHPRHIKVEVFYGQRTE